MKWGVAIALLAGLVAAVWLIWAIGFHPVLEAIGRAGLGGLAILCLYALFVFVVLAAAWMSLLPRAERHDAKDFYFARLVRDSLAEISPFSPVGGMVAAGRLMILHGMKASYAAASVAADATTEAMAQVAFLAFGLALGVAHFRHLASAGPLTEVMMATMLLAVPGIAALIVLQKKGADFAQRIAGSVFPASERRFVLPRRHSRALQFAAAAGGIVFASSFGLDRVGRRHLHRLPAGGRAGQLGGCAGAGGFALHLALHRRLRARRARRSGSGLCHARAPVRASRRIGSGGVAPQAGA